MRTKTLYTTVDDVDVDYDIKFKDLLELIENCDKEELDQIRDLVGDPSPDVGLKSNLKRMRGKTLYTTLDVDVEYDITFNDLLELIDTCDKYELDEIRNLIGHTGIIDVDNLYDEMKLKVLKVAFDKFNLDELKSKLDITDNKIKKADL